MGRTPLLLWIVTAVLLGSSGFMWNWMFDIADQDMQSAHPNFDLVNDLWLVTLALGSVMLVVCIVMTVKDSHARAARARADHSEIHSGAS